MYQHLASLRLTNRYGDSPSLRVNSKPGCLTIFIIQLGLKFLPLHCCLPNQLRHISAGPVDERSRRCSLWCHSWWWLEHLVQNVIFLPCSSWTKENFSYPKTKWAVLFKHQYSNQFICPNLASFPSSKRLVESVGGATHICDCLL